MSDSPTQLWFHSGFDDAQAGPIRVLLPKPAWLSINSPPKPSTIHAAISSPHELRQLARSALSMADAIDDVLAKEPPSDHPDWDGDREVLRGANLRGSLFIPGWNRAALLHPDYLNRLR